MTEPQWLDPTDDTPDGWYWCECLELDAPPQLLRSYRPLTWDNDAMMFAIDSRVRRVWQRWTVAGWASLTGRIAPCTGRPE